MNGRISWLLGAGLLSLAGVSFAGEPPDRQDARPAGENPNPLHLMRPPVAPLSAMAQLGKLIFFDAIAVLVGQARLRFLPQPGSRIWPAQ